MTHFESSVSVECSLETAFNFLLRPANISKVSHPDIGLTFTAAPEVIELGSLLEFKILARGQVQQITHEITLFERPLQFVEKQIRGPFKHWVHTHTFDASDEGVIVISDKIEFERPGGLIGLLVTEEKILDSLEDGFAHRHAQLRTLLAGTE